MHIQIRFSFALMLAAQLKTRVQTNDKAWHYFVFEDKQYDGRPDRQTLEELFERFNVGDPNEDEIVAFYREAHMPSLSVGMIVVLDDTEYLCQDSGWRCIR